VVILRLGLIKYDGRAKAIWQLSKLPQNFTQIKPTIEWSRKNEIDGVTINSCGQKQRMIELKDKAFSMKL